MGGRSVAISGCVTSSGKTYSSLSLSSPFHLFDESENIWRAFDDEEEGGSACMMVRNGTWKSECIAYHVRAMTAPEPGKRPGKGFECIDAPRVRDDRARAERGVDRRGVRVVAAREVRGRRAARVDADVVERAEVVARELRLAPRAVVCAEPRVADTARAVAKVAAGGGRCERRA